MLSLDRLLQEVSALRSGTDGAARATRPVSTPPAEPDWFGPTPMAAAHWDWLDATAGADPLAGLEVTEHSVPPGWFQRTFGTGAALAA